MTRESIPRFDLYGELEVSRLASVAVIEAAYRSLVKRHHPDVVRSTDEDRMKRLNLAREWLSDPVRRSWYDAATSRGTSFPPAGSLRAEARATSPASTRSTTHRSNGDTNPSEKTFGVNAAEVRHFLAELRGLDRHRALQVWDGHAVAHARGYTRARRVAITTGRSQRETEWLFAREAASVIARGKLGDSTLTDHVLEVVADVAGAIAIKDLISRSDYRLLLLPWTWEGDRVVAGTKPRATPAKPESTAEAVAAMTNSPAAVAAATASMSAPWSAAAQRLATAPPDERASPAATAAPPPPAPVAAPVHEPAHVPVQAAVSTMEQPPESPAIDAAPALPMAAPSGWEVTAAPSVEFVRPRTQPQSVGLQIPMPAVLAVAAVIAVLGGVAAFSQQQPAPTSAAVIDQPSLTPGAPDIGETAPPSTPASTIPVAIESGAPTTTSGPGPTGGPTVLPTPRPPAPTPPPPPPGPTPTPPPPTPTPAPTPTPSTMCMVPDFVTASVNTANAQLVWNDAGFSGTVSFLVPVPPQYKIGWQSLVADSLALCTSDVTVSDAAP